MFKNKLYTILKPYVEIVPLKMYALGEGKGVGLGIYERMLGTLHASNWAGDGQAPSTRSRAGVAVSERWLVRWVGLGTMWRRMGIHLPHPHLQNFSLFLEIA